MPSGFNLDLTYVVRANKNPPFSFSASSVSDGLFTYEHAKIINCEHVSRRPINIFGIILVIAN